MRKIYVGAALLLALLPIACQKTKYRVVAVKGKLTFADGQPLPAGTKIRFNPNEGGMGTAEAVTDASGGFSVTHVSGRAGAEQGKYIVLLAAPEGDRGAFYQSIPRDYHDGGVLVAEVKEGMGPLEFKVPKRGP